MTPPDGVPNLYRSSNTGVGSTSKSWTGGVSRRLTGGESLTSISGLMELRDKNDVIHDLRTVLHELLTLSSLAR